MWRQLFRYKYEWPTPLVDFQARVARLQSFRPADGAQLVFMMSTSAREAHMLGGVGPVEKMPRQT